jgi:hypothetical protein
VTTIQKENKKITKHNFQNNLILKDKIKKKNRLVKGEIKKKKLLKKSKNKNTLRTIPMNK